MASRSKMADHGSSSILDFTGPIIGSLKSPCATSYRPSIDTVAVNYWIFDKIAFFAFWRQTDRQTSILDFTGPIIGSLKSPCATSYRPSIDTVALNYWIFDKIAFFAFWRQTDRQTNRQTEKQMDSTDALSRSRCRERRLKNGTCHIAGCENYIRHIENRFSPYFIFFCFLNAVLGFDERRLSYRLRYTCLTLVRPVLETVLYRPYIGLP